MSKTINKPLYFLSDKEFFGEKEPEVVESREYVFECGRVYEHTYSSTWKGSPAYIMDETVFSNWEDAHEALEKYM